MSEEGLACAKDKFFAAAGAQYASNPKDYLMDEKIKFIPTPVLDMASVNPVSGSMVNNEPLQEVEHYWLHADTIGGKLVF